jgi:hypothetical protein
MGVMGRKLAGFDRAVVISGHMVDSPGRTPPRFPAEAEKPVRLAMERILDQRNIGMTDLAITAGARGADIIGAELCLARGAAVWLLVPLPEQEFLERSVRLSGSDWEERFHALAGRCVVCYQQDELGPPARGQDFFARNNQWCLDLGRATVGGEGLFGLVVWDGRTVGRDGGTVDFVWKASRRGIPIEIINPMTL